MSALPLPANALSCADCGALASGTIVEEVISFTSLVPMGDGGYTTREHSGALYRFGLCTMHAVRRASAEAMLRAHDKGVRHALGGWSYALPLFDAALLCLELMGAVASDLDVMVATDRSMLKLARELGPLGARARWAGRFQPPTRPDAAEGVYFTEPWEFEDQETMRDVRDGVEKLLREVTEKPMLVPPPTDGCPPACLVCGVSHIMVKPSQAASAWGPIRRMPLAALGGRDGSIVEGHLCDQDAVLLGNPPVWSISILDKSLMRFLGAPASAEYEFDGIRAWAADLPTATPSAERFEYLGDLTELREQVSPAGQAARRRPRYVRIP